MRTLARLTDGGTRRSDLNRVWAALTMLSEFDKQPCQINVLAVRSSLASLALDSTEFLRRHALEELPVRKEASSVPPEPVSDAPARPGT